MIRDPSDGSVRETGARCLSKVFGGEWCVGKCRDHKDCSAQPKVIDTSTSGLPMTKAKAYDLSIHSNPDGMAWTKFFRESNPDCNIPDDIMFGWFANAMMAMHDHMRPDLAPVVLPDGSAFCPG